MRTIVRMWTSGILLARTKQSDASFGVRDGPVERVIPGILDVAAENRMSERTYTTEERQDPDRASGPMGVHLTTEGGIFAWRGHEVVLLAQRTPLAFVLARGWAYDDRLVDIRRWSFPAPAGLAGQIRRLTREATGNHRIAAEAATAALAWAHVQMDSDADPQSI